MHRDCGLILFDTEGDDVHSGGSGCGCSASVLASYFLPLLESGELSRILFLSTGALMSTSSIYQGEHILGIAPAVVIERSDIS
jgi:stage V sporulation protein AD